MSTAAEYAEQGTSEWLMERCGKATASEAATVMVKGKGPHGLGAGAQTYAMEIAAEILTGVTAVHGACQATDWGNRSEEQARLAYERESGLEIATAPFIEHVAFDRIGGSPDGLVGDDGGVEIKCPFATKNHVQTIHSGRMPKEHKPQVQALLWVTDRKWWDFVSYDPRMPQGCDVFIQRQHRDEAYIEDMAARYEALLRYVDEIVEACRG